MKPNEFMTLSQHEMEKSGQIMYDSAFGTMNTARRGNSCSTLSRGGGGGYGRHPSMETGLNGYNGPMAYDTGMNVCRVVCPWPIMQTDICTSCALMELICSRYVSKGGP